MLNKRLLALAAALATLPQFALAQFALADEASRCVDISAPKKVIEAHHGKWINLTQNQWEFLRGIYAMNPLTPPGLPYGDRAALAKVDGDSGGPRHVARHDGRRGKGEDQPRRQRSLTGASALYGCAVTAKVGAECRPRR